MSDWPCGADKLPDEPKGYVQWSEWARTKQQTHEQQRCPVCDLWHVWTEKPKPTRRPA